MIPTFGSLFAGIGGFDLGLENAGWECKWQVENDKFCNQVLERHWPDVKRYGDIKKIELDELESVDLICGGFPCQPFSVAGKRRGSEDDRYLWPEMFRVISGIRPTWVIGENVAGIGNMVIDKICDDLESAGYEVAPPFEIPALAVGSPQLRFRWFFMAYSGGKRYGVEEAQIFPGWTCSLGCPGWSMQPRISGVAHGISNRVDRVKSLGNAVVPRVVEVIGKIIIECMKQEIRPSETP